MGEELAGLALEVRLQRFTTHFVDRISQAAEELGETLRGPGRQEVLRSTLRYLSAATEIATGAVSEANLLDMVVFLRLSRRALELHWIPRVYGAAGRRFLEAFERSEAELSGLVQGVLSPAQRAQLEAILRAWIEDHPYQVRVEGIRLSDFTETASSRVQLSGLMSGLTAAPKITNQALLLAERGIFLVHRLPALWRLQARLGAHEILSDLRWELGVRALTALGVCAAGGGLLLWGLSRSRPSRRRR